MHGGTNQRYVYKNEKGSLLFSPSRLLFSLSLTRKVAGKEGLLWKFAQSPSRFSARLRREREGKSGKNRRGKERKEWKVLPATDWNPFFPLPSSPSGRDLLIKGEWSAGEIKRKIVERERRVPFPAPEMLAGHKIHGIRRRRLLAC